MGISNSSPSGVGNGVVSSGVLAQLQKAVASADITLRCLTQELEGTMTAESAYCLGVKCWSGYDTVGQMTLVLMGGSSSIQGVIVSRGSDGILTTVSVPELTLLYGIKGLNVRDFIRDTVMPLKEQCGWDFMILTSGFYLGIDKSKEEWAINFKDQSAFIPSKTDVDSCRITTPNMVFHDDDGTIVFEELGLVLREVTVGGVVLKPTFTNETTGDLGGASVYAKGINGPGVNIEFTKGCVGEAAAALVDLSGRTGVNHFLCTGVWRESA
jgi:hypothetical protein